MQSHSGHRNIRQHVHYTRGTWAVLLISAIIALMFAAFLMWRITEPSELARMNVEVLEPIQSDGVVVVPLPDDTTTLFQAGDKVLAIERATMSSIARGVVEGPPIPPIRIGHQRIYTVMREGRILDLLVAPKDYPSQAIVSNAWGLLVMYSASLIVVLVAFLRRPNELMVRAMLMWVQGISGTVAFAVGVQVADLLVPWRYWHWVILTIGGVILFGVGILRFALTFTPHTLQLLRALNTPRAVFVTYAAPFTLVVLTMVVGWFVNDNKLDWLALWKPIGTVVLLVFCLLFVLVMALAYVTDNDAVTRTKIRLVVFGGVVSSMSMLLFMAFPTLILGYPLISFNELGLFGLPITLAIAIAIFRYRLIDIDFVINRALVYGFMSLVLAIAYFGLLIAAQSLLGPLIGNDRQLLEIVTVLTTLVAAAMFSPMRTWVQGWVDRHFYRSKYEAQQAFARFATQARGQADLNKLTVDLSDTVQQAMNAEHVSVWVRGGRS
jgi:hypothetical protein